MVFLKNKLALLPALLLLAVAALPPSTASAATAYDHSGSRDFWLYSPDGSNAVLVRYSIDAQFLVSPSNSTVYVSQTFTALATGQSQLGYSPDAVDVTLGNITTKGPALYSRSSCLSFCVFAVPTATLIPVDVGFGQVYGLGARYVATCQCSDPVAVYQATLGYIQAKLSDNTTVTLSAPKGGAFALFAGGDIAFDGPSSLPMLPEYSAQVLPNLAPVLPPAILSLQAQLATAAAQVSALQSQAQTLQSQVSAAVASYASLYASWNSLESQYQGLQKTYAAADANLTALRSAYSDSQSSLSSLVALYSQSQAANTRLSDSLAALNATPTSLKQSYSSAASQVSTLYSRSSALFTSVLAESAQADQYRLDAGIASFLVVALMVVLATVIAKTRGRNP